VLAGGLVLGAACAALLVVCWRQRSALGGVCGFAGLVLAGLSLSGGAAALAGAALALVVGGVLLGLGAAIQRLLDDEPEE
jgi:hypothetical protein